MRRIRLNRGAHLSEVVVRQRLAEHRREGANDSPVFTRFSRRESSALAALDAAFGIGIEAVFFGIGSTRQNDVGAMRALVAMRALIDHESGDRTSVVEGKSVSVRVGIGGRRCLKKI